MVDIRHRVGIDAPRDLVYRTVATRDGLSRWWTHDVRGNAEPGERLEFYFGGEGPSAVMKIVELEPPDRVGWLCVEGPAEWVGTTLSFEVKDSGDETALVFTHAGWEEPVEFLHHCSTKWAYHLLGLKSGLEGGAATPFPDDRRVSSWG